MQNINGKRPHGEMQSGARPSRNDGKSGTAGKKTAQDVIEEVTRLPRDLSHLIADYEPPAAPHALLIRSNDDRSVLMVMRAKRLLAMAPARRPPVSVVTQGGKFLPARVEDVVGDKVFLAFRLEDAGVRKALGERATSGERHFAFDTAKRQLEFSIAFGSVDGSREAYRELVR